MLAAGCGVGGDGAAVEDAVPVPEHLHALAKVLEALRLRVHRAPAVWRPAHASAPRRPVSLVLLSLIEERYLFS